MIARTWRGAVAREDGDAYADYMQATGIAGYVRVPGNRGAWMLRRDVGDRTEFVMFTLPSRGGTESAVAGRAAADVPVSYLARLGSPGHDDADDVVAVSRPAT